VTIRINQSSSFEELPKIEVDERQLREITDDALDAVVRDNKLPRVFRYGEALVALEIEEPGGVRLRPLAGKALRHHLARVADWYRAGKPIAPPKDVVGDIEVMSEEGLLDIPSLEAIVNYPVLTAGGEITTLAGYHFRSRLWYQPDNGLSRLKVPRNPSPAEIDRARAFINDNLFADFPFVDEIDRTVAWSVVLLPHVRQVIDGPTPLDLIKAPAPGTGKTLLAQVLMAPALGQQHIESMTVDCEEPEMRKRLTAKLINSPTFVFMDNLGQNRRLESSSLASILTSRNWTDRLLKSSSMVSIPVRSIFLATGNNPVLSDEMVRRTIRSRLDTGLARPHRWKKGAFKHPHLLAWVREHRQEILQAILTLVRAWQAAGRPKGDINLGMFESWGEVMGGLLDVAGIPGLGQAIERDQGRPTTTEQSVAPFIHAWWNRYRSKAVGAKELFIVATEAGCLEEVLDVHLSPQNRQRNRGQETLRAKQTRLGNALQRLAGQVIAGYKILAAGTDHCYRQTYRLEPIAQQGRVVALAPLLHS
jgi:hypothetical protein